MRYSYLIAFVLLAAGVWWWLGDDPEDRVREAHATLERLLSQTEDDTESSIPVLQIRELQTLFAETCTLTGDAGTFAARYSPQELVGLIVRVRGAVRRVELGFGELAIDFPSDDVAVTSFSASLDGVDLDGEAFRETREVESRMQEVDGAWQFVSFDFAEIAPEVQRRD